LKNTYTLTELENILHHLNYRWKLEALAQWKGVKGPFGLYRIYEGFDDFLNLETMKSIEELEDSVARTRLQHALIDHYLQRTLLPYEAEMRTWMRGAAAHVNGRKIYIRDIIPWCQKSSTYSERRILQKETGPLCKFLKPFVINYWHILLKILQEEMGFEDYLDYCSQKKGIDYYFFYRLVRDLLERTDEFYFNIMEKWTKRRYNRPLNELSRFDAINMLGLAEFDKIFRDRNIGMLITFFDHWRIDIENLSGLNLEVGWEEGKSAQAISFILQVPDEVYILMRPQGGWIDLETLGHELGHGLSSVFTSPDLLIVDRDMATSYSLSESFAFLLQNLCLSRPFLEDYLGMEQTDAEELYYYKVLKDFSLFRRYGAKFIIEFEMFSSGNLTSGKLYADTMARYTGFYYQPECHLFDLVPEFYSLDFLIGWMAAALMEEYLCEHVGSDWIFCAETGEMIKRWWNQGNRYDVFQFLEKNGLDPLAPEKLLSQWEEILR